jgi:hypothetical protein
MRSIRSRFAVKAARGWQSVPRFIVNSSQTELSHTPWLEAQSGETIGLKVPASLLARADEVIEELCLGLLMAQSGLRYFGDDVRLRGYSGHPLRLAEFPLLTESRHALR